MIYTKKFITHADYNVYINGQNKILPNVSYCKDNNEVHYNPIVVGINTYISCVDIASGEELAGSHIQVIDQDGRVVEEWDSTTEVHEVEGLNIETTYTLRTTVAPDGYILPEDITFTINENGEIDTEANTTIDEYGNTVLLVELFITHVEVSCVDIADGEELEGAHIEVIDSEGNIADEWDSTDTAHAIEGLYVGEEYTLRNTVASEGYVLATDTTFTIDETGNVTSIGTISEDGILLVEFEKTQVQVLCVDIADGAELEGSHIQVIDKDGHVIEEWDSTTEAHEVNGLKTGEEYTLSATVASDGFTLPTDTTFTIDETGHVTSIGTILEDGILAVELEKTKVRVLCVDIASGEEVEGTHIQIIDHNGEVAEEWDSEIEHHVIEGLKTGEEYTLKVTYVPEPYGNIIPDDTTFTIDETGEVTSTGTTATDEDGNTVLLVEFTRTVINS